VAPGGKFLLPKAKGGNGINRTFYFIEGKNLEISQQTIDPNSRVDVNAGMEVELSVPKSASRSAELLMLQGKPIGEPIAQHGPFVMNSQAEVNDSIVYNKERSFLL